MTPHVALRLTLVNAQPPQMTVRLMEPTVSHPPAGPSRSSSEPGRARVDTIMVRSESTNVSWWIIVAAVGVATDGYAGRNDQLKHS